MVALQRSGAKRLPTCVVETGLKPVSIDTTNGLPLQMKFFLFYQMLKRVQHDTRAFNMSFRTCFGIFEIPIH